MTNLYRSFLGYTILTSEFIPMNKILVVSGNCITTHPHTAFRIELELSCMDLIPFVHNWRDRKIQEIEEKCNRLIKEPIPFHLLNFKAGEELCLPADTI